MDMKKTGEFLAGLRRERSLTQAQLGEKLGVSNKTISRWETGTYMPPIEALEQLSDFYGVTINEIINGGRAEEKNFRAVAEENIKAVLRVSSFSLQEKMEFFKSKWKKEHLFELIAGIIILVALFIFGIIAENGLSELSLILAIAGTVVRYNRMMTYVEKRAFSPDNNER